MLSALVVVALMIPKVPDPKSALDAAKGAMGAGRYAEALATLDLIQATGDAEARRLFLKARVLARSGDPSGAIEQLGKLPAVLSAATVAPYLESSEGEADFAKARDDLAFEQVRAALRALAPAAARPRILGKSVCVALPGKQAARCAAKRCPADMIAVKRVKPAPACGG
jgi:hypothetical protein